ncbi:MAG: AzlD domain-containing protein [Jatrophihabitantaceae bacterium]
MTVLAIMVLAGGTYGLRLAGPALHSRITLSAQRQWLLSLAATVLLCALAAVSTLTTGQGFGGWARTVGVLVGGLLAVRRLPFIVVVIAAAAITALLRLAGVS